MSEAPLHQMFHHYSELPFSMRVLFTGALCILGFGYLFALVYRTNKMKTPDGHDILGPMAGYKQAWSILSDRDARAVAVFIKSLPSVRDNLRDDKARVSTK